MGVASLPTGVAWRTLLGVATLGGIGFTMSLFIAGLAFGGAAEALTAAKLGTMTASVVAGVAGWLLLRSVRPTVPAMPLPHTSAAPSPSP